MDDTPKITIKDFFEEVTPEKMDAAARAITPGYIDDEELQDKIVRLIASSKIMSGVVRNSCSTRGANPQEAATDLTLGFIIGVSLVINLLNESEEIVNPAIGLHPGSKLIN